MKNILISLRMLLVMSIITGLAYPLIVTALAKGFFPAQAGGSMMMKDGNIVGSSLISQKFTSEKYFWPRPSACDYNASASSGSNYGPTSAALKKAVDDRKAALLKAHPGQAEIPEDLLFASASGLDPHISLAAARYQAPRVARMRKMDPSRVLALIDSRFEPPQFGIFGEPRVNVFELNLALDGLHEKD